MGSSCATPARWASSAPSRSCPGHIRGLTNTMPLQVEILYNEYNFVAAFAVASLLAVLAILTLVLKTLVEWRAGTRRRLRPWRTAGKRCDGRAVAAHARARALARAARSRSRIGGLAAALDRRARARRRRPAARAGRGAGPRAGAAGRRQRTRRDPPRSEDALTSARLLASRPTLRGCSRRQPGAARVLPASLLRDRPARRLRGGRGRRACSPRRPARSAGTSCPGRSRSRASGSWSRRRRHRDGLLGASGRAAGRCRACASSCCATSIDRLAAELAEQVGMEVRLLRLSDWLETVEPDLQQLHSAALTDGDDRRPAHRRRSGSLRRARRSSP